MYLADYHLHTINSPDGFEEIEQICEAAVLQGISEIAITDHVDFASYGCFTNEVDGDKIHRDMARAKHAYEGRLIVKKGVELGQPQANPKDYENYMGNYDHDFIIGSIHNLKSDCDIYYFDYHKMDCDLVYKQYIEEMLILADNYDFDVMGHLTYPLRYMYLCDEKTVELKNYEGEFRVLFKKLIEKGRGIEINTSGLRQAIGQTLPPLYLLKLFKECGGEFVTIGSDAHKAKDVGKGIAKGQELLKEAGFTCFTTYEKRKPTKIKLD